MSSVNKRTVMTLNAVDNVWYVKLKGPGVLNCHKLDSAFMVKNGGVDFGGQLATKNSVPLTPTRHAAHILMYTRRWNHQVLGVYLSICALPLYSWRIATGMYRQEAYEEETLRILVITRSLLVQYAEAAGEHIDTWTVSQGSAYRYCAPLKLTSTFLP